jgi:hypothetical protein
MPKLWFVAAIVVCALVAGCAPSLREDGLTTGLFVSPSPGGYYVRFDGNSSSTDEAVDAYWLYNCAVLALQKGYDGFVLDGSNLSVSNRPGVDPLLIGAGAAPFVLAQTLPGLSPGKVMQANIVLVKKPFSADASHVFDAAEVRDKLRDFAANGSCAGMNRCAHPLSALALSM